MKFIFTRGYRLRDKIKLLLFSIIGLTTKLLKIKRELQYSIINKLVKDTIVVINGLKYMLPDYESLWIVSPSYERTTLEMLCSELRQGMVFVDVGAHIGKYTVIAGRLVGSSGLVIAIEPHPENFRYLLMNIKLNGLSDSVVVLNYAAYNEDCRLKLYFGDTSGHHSLKRKSTKYVNVVAKRLDTIIKELHVARVDWIKIDVEGSECEVLKGSREALRRYKPKMIVEVSNENLTKVLSMLREFNYEVKPIEKRGTHVQLLCIPVNVSFVRHVNREY